MIMHSFDNDLKFLAESRFSPLRHAENPVFFNNCTRIGLAMTVTLCNRPHIQKNLASYGT